MSFLNSRKVSWIIFGITLLTAVVSLFFLPDIIPVHFGILGTPDGWVWISDRRRQKSLQRQ